LPKDSLYNSDNTNKDVSYSTLFFDTKMINAQEGFFDISKIGTKDSSFKASTSFGLNEINYDSLITNEYILYTEFNKVSKPAVLNYITVGNIALNILSNSKSLGYSVNENVKNFLKQLNKVKTLASNTISVVSMVNNIYGTILNTAYLDETSDDYKKQTPYLLYQSLQNTIDETTLILSAVGASVPDISSKMVPSEYSTDSIYDNALRKTVFTLFDTNTDSKYDDVKAFVTNKTIKDAVYEGILSILLQPFSYNGSFYYPKDGNFLTVYTKINSTELTTKYDKISVSDLAGLFRTYINNLNNNQPAITDLTYKDLRIIKLTSKSILHAGGQKIFEKFKKIASDTKSIKKATELAESIINGSMSNIITSEKMFKIANGFFDLALNKLGEAALDIGLKLSGRLLSYAVPGAGWAKASVDLADAGNTAGAFALDFFTAPRQVPFLIKNKDGVDKVFEPFTMNLIKLSYLKYPYGQINNYDPFSNGQYTFDSYFLAGNSIEPQGENFKPWNINNRDVTLVANGVVYSYDMRIGAFDHDGRKAFHNIFNFKDEFDNGLYDLNFDVKKYDNDDLENEPQTFTSPLTGVQNQENQVIDENYLTKSIGLNFINTTDYKIRHTDKNDAHNVFEWETGIADWLDTDTDENNVEYEFYGEDDDNLGTDTNSLLDTFSGNDFYYLSFKDQFVTGLETNYGNTFSVNYDNDKGIMHSTPGIYEVKIDLGINNPNNTDSASSQTKFKDKQLLFVMASVHIRHIYNRHHFLNIGLLPNYPSHNHQKHNCHSLN